jgi:hypothetical protein
MRRWVFITIAVAAVIAAVAWLRDPAWLSRIESGFSRWESDEHGARYRWTAGRASFFVQADLAEVRIPMRLPFERGDWPVVVSVTMDDRPADRFTIDSGNWYESHLRLPPPGSRRHRRIDIHVNRTRPGNRGVQVGELELVR